MKKLKLTIVFMSILLVSIFVSSSFDLFESIAVETELENVTEKSTDLVGGTGVPEKTVKKAYAPVAVDYPKITTFPINGAVFNSDPHYFCVQHGVAYGGQYIGNYVGTTQGEFHHGNKATDNALGGGSSSDMTADVPSSSTDFYIDEGGTFHDDADISHYYSYKEDGETGLDYVFTNWLYLAEDIKFSCEDGDDEKTGLAFLFACYIAGGNNNGYVRSNGYQKDPMQHAVWASFLNTGNSATNSLAVQQQAYVDYHRDSEDPNVNTKPDEHVGTVLNGTTYVVGPFEMYDYVEADDYKSPKVSVGADTIVDTGSDDERIEYDEDGNPIIEVDSVQSGNVSHTDQTLQDAFGEDDDKQGTIIKAEAVLSNGVSTYRVEFDVPEDGKPYYINIDQSKIQAGYDEIEDVIFTYQRIHACAEGTKYTGLQYRLKFDEDSEEDSSCTYDCTEHTPSYASHETGAPEGGSQTCTYTWDCDDHDEGCGCAGGHTRSGCSCGGYTTKPDGSKGSPICDGHRRSGCNCACDGHSDTHTSIFKCEHDHEECKEISWTYSGTAGDVAQDGYAGSGELVNEIIEYKIKVEIPIKTEMRIYKYITDVKHRLEGGTNDLTVPDRSGMSVTEKEADSVKVERGDIVTYKVIVENKSRFPTAVKVRDMLPDQIENLEIPAVFEYTGGSGGSNTASWIEVPAKDKIEYTIKLDPDALSGTYVNTAEFITTNAGPEHMKYVKWGDTATHGPHTYGDIVNIATDHQSDSDFYTIKEYDVTVDKYIRKVNHVTNGVATFDKTDRMKVLDEGTKSGNPVYAEFGDLVTYHIDIYNTCEEFMTAEKQVRSEEPYWNPDIAYVDIEDTLPQKYSALTVEVSNGSGSKSATAAESNSGGTIKITDIQVPAGGKVTVTVTLVVEEVTRETVEENKATISGDVRNVNKKVVKNNSTKTETSDWYKIQDYNLSINKFISDYESTMTESNNANKFTNETNILYDKRNEMTNDQKKVAPVHAEKTDKIIYTIIAKNDAVAGPGLKYATQVRPSEIRDRMDDGLTFESVHVAMKTANGEDKHTNLPYTYTEEGNNTYVFSIPEKVGDEYLILEPGEYMEYTVTVEVTKTNMYLFDLTNEASIKTLTNINSDINTKVRVVTEQNITPSPNSFEYVKLKDLVIAGKVWLDTDEDGYMGINKSGNLGGSLDMADKPSIDQADDVEYAIEGIVVKLYESDGTLVRTTKTDESGLFTFSRAEELVYYAGTYNSTPEAEIESEQRIPKATKNANNDYDANSVMIDYYIEYEYDGLVYRSTEKYSYKDNLAENAIFAGSKDPATGYYLYEIDSNAYEFDHVRKAFNEHYAVMSYNQAADFDEPTKTAVLEFEKKDHESFIKEDPERANPERDPIIMTSRSFIIKDTTETDYLWLYEMGQDTEYPETEYLKYINLGLEERDKFDLRLQKDLIDVEVKINGFDMDYEYGTVKPETLYYKRQGDDVANENEELYNLYLYKSDYFFRYEMYENKAVRDDKALKEAFDELQVNLHYRITVTNESAEDEFARIYEIVDYNTSTMQFKEAKLDDGTVITADDTSLNDYNKNAKYVVGGKEGKYWNLNSGNAEEVTVAAENYEVKFLHGMENKVLKTGESFTIDLTYSVDKFHPDNEYPEDLNARSIYVDDKFNVAQIGVYAAFEEEAAITPKGLVDNDSNAANINNDCVIPETGAVDIEDIAKYEDNAFRVGLNIDEKQDERTVDGFVFEDTRSEKIEELNATDSLNHFTGNGIYNTNDDQHDHIDDMKTNAGMSLDSQQDLLKDKKLDGMTVELVEIITVDGKTYEETIDPLDFANRGNVVVQTQTADGKYVIDSFIPGTYVVRFRYGDIYVDASGEQMTKNSLLHNGQDYKSTSYVLTESLGVPAEMTTTSSLFRLIGSATLPLVENTTDNEVKFKALSQENYSDARDNELRRIEVMAESEVMNHRVAEFMKYINYNEATLNDELRAFEKATNGFADTVTVTLAIEERDDTRDKLGESVMTGVNKVDLNLALPNVDYGVVFRPENFIEMTKKIKNIKLTTMDGEVLVDLEYDIEGNLTREIGKHNVQAVNTIDRTQGFRYINVDEDLIQGASLAIEYFMIVNNIGEVDTVNKLLVDEEGSEKVLAKLNAQRSVIKSDVVKPDGTSNGDKDNYIRVSDLISQVYGRAYDYGFFVGDIYYEGEAADRTDIVVVPLKVSKILDFIDNDASFVQANNSVKNKFWTMTKEEELLRDGLIGEGGLKTITTGIESTLVYLDDEARQYVTKEKLNLVYNVGTAIDNPSLVRNIIPVYADQGNDEAFIVIQLDDVLGGDDESESMVYDNVAEIIEFITPVGRRTNFASTVGNIELNGTKKPFEAALVEVDSDGTEVVRLTPPTGRDKLNLMMSGSKYIIIGTITLVMAVVIVYITAYSLKGKVGKSKFYK